MLLSKDLLIHVQWYFTREAKRLEEEHVGWPEQIRAYNKYLEYLEEVRTALKQYESNTELPWHRVIYCRRSS